MNKLLISLKPFKNIFRRIIYLLRLIYSQGLKVTLGTILGHILPERRARIRYPCGDVEVIVKSRDLPFWKPLEKKKWEYAQLNFLYNLSIRNQVVFDVGAWKGPYTLFLANLVGKQGQVEAFEPMPDTFKTLVNNVRLNNLNNVNCYNAAVSDIDGNIEIKAPTSRSQVASVVRYGNDDKLIAFSSQSVTIDSFCEENNIVPDGIKIDVEGAEGLVFKGALETIKTYKPWVFVEFHGDLMSEYKKKACWELITKGAQEIVLLRVKGADVQHYNSGEAISKGEIPAGTFNVYIRY